MSAVSKRVTPSAGASRRPASTLSAIGRSAASRKRAGSTVRDIPSPWATWCSPTAESSRSAGTGSSRGSDRLVEKLAHPLGQVGGRERLGEEPVAAAERLLDGGGVGGVARDVEHRQAGPGLPEALRELAERLRET